MQPGAVPRVSRAVAFNEGRRGTDRNREDREFPRVIGIQDGPTRHESPSTPRPPLSPWLNLSGEVSEPRLRGSKPGDAA